MELLKDIYFNTDKLVENANVKVSYTGKFYQGDNDKVFIHYGYGKNWDNVQEVEMKKTDLGYQAELNLASDETINFCFKNQNNEWDNNFGNNYIFNIEKATVNELGATTVGDVLANPTASELNSIINPISNIVNSSEEATTINTPIKEIAEAAGINCTSENAEHVTALVKNSKFQSTMKKVRASIVKFFASVPKFISGNYKRILGKKDNK